MATTYIMRDGVIYEARFDDSGNYTLGDVHDIPAESVVSSEARTHKVDKSYYAGKSTDISIEETYNKIQITCDCDDIEDVIKSPLEEDDVKSYYSGKQHYCTEYVSWGNGKTAANAFLDMVHGRGSSYDSYETHKWYVQQMYNDNWKFNTDSFMRTDNMYQCTIPRLLYTNGQVNRATLLNLGKVKTTSPGDDNSLTNSLDMKTYLVISMIGRGELAGEETYPKLKDFYKYAPCAEYVANGAIGRYSPTDTTTHNYFVIKGKIGLARRSFVTKRWKTLKSIDNRKDIWHATVHLDDSKNKNGAYYAIQFFDNPSPNDKVDTEWDSDTSFIRPLNTDWKDDHAAQYKESAGDIDRISYVPFIECEMKIGDYYLIEKFDGYKNFPILEWMKWDELPVFVDANGVKRKQTFFSIGVNPKFKDWIVGKQYPIANMIDTSYGIEDEEGMLIPLPYEKNLTGKIEFKILGPAYIQSVDGICSYHKEWQTGYYYDEDGTAYEYQYLATVKDTESPFKYADSMWIEDFEVKIVSDNGGVNNGEDKDLIYVTETNPNGNFISIKDDIDFKLSTQLTTAEALEKGISQVVKQNNPSIVSDSSALRSVYNTITGDSGKPEEHYLTHYWNEYNKPKILFTTEFKDTPLRSWTSHYKFNQFHDKNFFVQSESYNVKYCKKELTLKEM